MLKRLISGIMISCVVVILPVLGNVAVLRAPHLWILMFLGVLASVFQPGYNPFTITAKQGDRGTGAQIIWSVYLTQLAAVLEAAYLRYPDSVRWDLTAGIAVVAAVLGLALRTWAVFTLGRFFTMHLDIHKGHCVVTKGPFRIVRHPSYLGAFIMYAATIVFLHAWFSVIVAIPVLIFAFVRRILCEEDLLKRELGDEYAQYCFRVKRFLPGIW